MTTAVVKGISNCGQVDKHFQSQYTLCSTDPTFVYIGNKLDNSVMVLPDHHMYRYLKYISVDASIC